MNMSENETFDWKDSLPPPKEFDLLPEGDAEFEVLKLDRARKEMGKLGTVNVAIVKLLVTSMIAQTDPQPVEVNLPLSPKTVFKLYQFFAAIGQYKHGDVESGTPFTPNWSKVVGATGLCVVKHRPWKTKDGQERKGADIDVFLDEHGRTKASDKPRAVGKTESNSKEQSFDQVPF
jgi:hypothetical protein